MRRKLRNNWGSEHYALRMEAVFGQIKQGRGFRQFLLRGLEKVNQEWLLISAAYNLLKLFRFGGRLPVLGLGNGPTRNLRLCLGSGIISILERLSGHLHMLPAEISVAY